MAKYGDRRRARGPSTCHYKSGEDPSARHERRKQTAAQERAEMEAWCNANGATLEVKNDGHHWIIERRGRRAQWWPSSAKLVLGVAYHDGTHVHCVRQVVSELTRRWKIDKEVRDDSRSQRTED